MDLLSVGRFAASLVEFWTTFSRIAALAFAASVIAFAYPPKTWSSQQAVNPKTGDPSTEVVRLRKLLKSDDPDQQAKAVIALGKLGPKAADAVPDLLRMYFDPNLKGPVRDDILIHIALDDIGHGASPEYARILRKGTDEQKADILNLLLTFYRPGHETLDAAILDCLVDSGPDFERIRAMTIALVGAKARIKSGVDTIIKAAGDPAWEQWSSIVGVALENLGPDAKAALPALERAFRNPKKSPAIRRDFIGALAAVGKNDGKTFRLIRQILLDPDETVLVRYYAARGIGTSKFGQQAIADLVAIAGQVHPENPKETDLQLWRGLRVNAVESIAQLQPDKSALPALLSLLKQKEDGVKQRGYAVALTAVAKIGPDAKEAVPELLKLIDDEAFDTLFQSSYLARALVAILGREKALETVRAFKANDAEARLNVTVLIRRIENLGK